MVAGCVAARSGCRLSHLFGGLAMALSRRCCCALFLAMTLPAAGPLVAANTGWKTVRPEGGAFTCEMPGEPKRKSQNVPTPAGMIDVVSYMLEGPTGTYVVS